MRTYAPAPHASRPGPAARGAVARPRRPPPRGHPRARRRSTGTGRSGWTRGSGPGSRGAGSSGRTSTRPRRSRRSTRGEDIVVVTPTASGKSLCYTVPVLQALAEDPSARALFLFPTKALGQDQVAEFGELVHDAGLDDVRRHATTATRRRRSGPPIRKAGQVVVTNPDMLHSAMLPHHTKWFQLFEQLRVIVIDELHTYRGVFGSHVANVLRRLLRLCAHYGSNPVIVCCSATIGNPGELAEQLTGRPVRLDRPQRRAVGREARPARGSADHRCGDRRPRVGADPRPALGDPVPARRAPDRRVREEPGRGRDHAVEPARDAARGPRAAAAGSAATGAATCRRSAGRSSAACATARCSAS